MTENNGLEGRILVVDDDECVRDILPSMLRKHSVLRKYYVDTAENGLVALNMIKSAYDNNDPYVTFISDLNMPELDGLGLIKAVKKDSKYKYTPFIFMSAATKDKEQLAMKQSGAFDIIKKPLDFKIVYKSLENAVKFGKQNRPPINILSFSNIYAPTFQYGFSRG